MQFEAILSDLNFQSPKTTKQNMTKVKKLKARLLKLKNQKKIDLLVQIFSTVPENYDVRWIFVVIRQFEVLKSFPKNCLHSFILVFVHNNV